MASLEKLYGERIWRQENKKPIYWNEVPKEMIARSADLLLDDIRITERNLIDSGFGVSTSIKEDFERRLKLANDMKSYSFMKSL